MHHYANGSTGQVPAQSTGTPTLNPSDDPLDQWISIRKLGEIVGHHLGRGPIHVNTVRNWAARNKGKFGVILKTFMHLGVRMTTLRDYIEFEQEVNRRVEEMSRQFGERMEEIRQESKAEQDRRQQEALDYLKSSGAMSS